jgi:hypothetical protein
MDALRDKIDQILQKEDKRKEDSKKVFQEVFNTPVKSKVLDTKAVQLISMFDDQRRQMEAEISFLRYSYLLPLLI